MNQYIQALNAAAEAAANTDLEDLPSDPHAKLTDDEDYEMLLASQIEMESLGDDLSSMLRDYDTALNAMCDLEALGAEVPLTGAGFALVYDRIEGVGNYEGYDMESFSSETISLESKQGVIAKIGANLKKFWQYLRKMFSTFIDSISDMVAKLMGSWKKLMTRVEAASAALNAGVKEGDVKYQTAYRVMLDGKYDNKIAMRGLTALEGEITTVKDINETLKAISEVDITGFIKGTATAANEEEVQAPAKKFLAPLGKLADWITGKSDAPKPTIQTTGNLPGDRKLSLVSADKRTQESATDFIDRFSVGMKMPSIVMLVERNKKHITTVEAPALDAKFGSELVKVTELYADEAAKFGDYQKALKDAAKTNLAEWDKMIVAEEKGTIGAFWTKTRVRRMSYCVTNEQTRQYSKFITYVFGTLRVYAMHAEASAA